MQHTPLIEPETVERYWRDINIYDGPDLFQRSTANLPQVSLDIYAANFCLEEVQNGGFAQLFCNSTGMLIPLAIEALRRLGMPQLADVFASAARELGSPFPGDRTERLLRLSSMTGSSTTFETWELLHENACRAVRQIAAFTHLEKQTYALMDTESGGYSAAATAYISQNPLPSMNGASMTDLVRKQLQQSIDTMTRVLHDDAIHTTVVEAGRITAEAMKAGKKLLVCGNGGSAADAQHLVAEFVSRLTVDRPALRAIALTTDTSILTAIGNDYSYDNVFERQIEALGQQGDVLLAISTSGNSKNCIKALKKAKEMGVRTVAYTGNNGGGMAALAELNVIIPSPTTMNIQESHLALEHIFCMVVERFYFGEDFGSKPQQIAE